MGRAESPQAVRGTAARLAVTVVFSPRASATDEVALELPVGATVADALRASGLELRHRGLGGGRSPIGVWGRPCARDTALRDGDRVEIYRPLVVDAKEARRLRQCGQVAAIRGGKRR